jgi:hypothetical protein
VIIPIMLARRSGRSVEASTFADAASSQIPPSALGSDIRNAAS